MRTTTKRALSLLLVCVMLMGMLPTSAFAANTQGVSFAAALDTAKLTVSDQPQTVQLSLNPSKAVTVDGIGYIVDMGTTGFGITAVSSTDSRIAYSSSDMVLDSSKEGYGTVGWSSADGDNIENVTNLSTVTVTVPANTPAGSYTLGFKKIELTKDYGDIWENNATAYATLTIEDAAPTAKAFLSGLEFRSSTKTATNLLTAFDPSVKEYGLELAQSVSTFWMTATLSADAPENSTISVEYLKADNTTGTVNMTSGTAKSLALGAKMGNRVTPVTITVGVEGNEQVYKINVNPKKTGYLSTLTMAVSDGGENLLTGFDSDTLLYNINVAPGTEKLYFVCKPHSTNAPNATVTAGEATVQQTGTNAMLNNAGVYKAVTGETIPVTADGTAVTCLTLSAPVTTKTVLVNVVAANGTKTNSYMIRLNPAPAHATPEEAFGGSGTAGDPYIISTQAQLNEFALMVNGGMSFAGQTVKLGADITLPGDWTPIGVCTDTTLNVSKGLNAFSGTFDGDGHTVTVPKGGLPLFGYICNTTIKNLKIYGEQINGYGLVNNFEGVNLTSVTTIDNVTLLSGTKTLKSGLVGANITTNGWAGNSITSVVNISNCTVESGVTIGYTGTESGIGSICGLLQGTVTNCVSNATVMGVSHVGGIVGSRDNALGEITVSNCSFGGSVSGSSYVGGIVGGGYFTANDAPNGGKISLIGNTVTGTVSGTDCVGGISGGDTYVTQVWDNVICTVQNNRFEGTVSGSSNVGAIIGFYCSLNCYDLISGNTFSADCGAAKGIAAVQYVDTSCAAPTAVDGTTYFNTAIGTSGAPAGASRLNHNRTDDPLGADADKLWKKDAAPACEHTMENHVCTKCGITEYTIKLAPTTVTIDFGSEELKSEGISGKYNVYTLTAMPGSTVTYSAVDGSVDMGSGTLKLGAATATYTLARHNFYASYAKGMEDWTITSFTDKTDAENPVVYTLGEKFDDNGTAKQVGLLIGGHKYGLAFTMNAALEEDYYVTNLADWTVSASVNTAQNKTLPINAYKTFTLVAPSDAEVKFFNQTKNYVVAPMSETELTKTVNAESGTTTYLFKSKSTNFGSGNYTYRVTKEGMTTAAGYMETGKTVTIPADIAAANALAYDDRSILLNIDDSKDTNELAMQVGDSFKLRAFRAPWEIINTQTANMMIEPDFHYSILSGTDVISVTPVSEFEEGKTSGNAKGNWMNITAQRQGTAVLAVWYDAISITGSGVGNGFYGASDPARYGYVVVTVGSDATVAINPVSQDGDWDAEFDTVYYTGDNGTFSFTSDAATSVTVANLYGSSMGAARSVTKGEDGKWNVPVQSGSNLITINSAAGTDYRLVRAARITITYTNVTTQQTANDIADLTVNAGDTLKLHFNGLHMPVPKMSGIYNPGYMGTAKTAYVLDGKYSVLSAGTQYDFSVSEKSDLSFKVPTAGEHTLKGYISLSSMGDDFGNHRNITDDGRAANMNASEKFGSFGILPELSFTAAEGSASAFTYDEVTKLNSVQLIVGGTTAWNYYAMFNIKSNVGVNNVTNNKSSGWKGLYCMATADSFYNSLSLTYWYEGEEPVTVPLTSGAGMTLSETDFTVNTAKPFYAQITVTPGDASLGEPKVYNFVVMGGSANLQYVHPMIKSLTVTDSEGAALALDKAMDYITTDYTLDVGTARSINLSASMLQMYTNATNNKSDKADTVTVRCKAKGENVGEAVTVAPADENAYPTGKWTLENLDISQTDALEIKVISYVDGTTRTYSIALEKREPTTVTAYVNMSAAGKLVTDKNGKTMARIPVMLNTKESYTINDLLKKFHEQHHPDGAAAYAVVNDPDYGPSVSKLWGDASGNFGYQLNGASVAVWGPSDTIRNGDTLDVTLYANSYPDTESYTAFSAYTLSTNSITPVTLTLNGGSYDDNWALVMAPLAGATLTVDGVATEAVTDANGQATLTIAAPGTHIVSAEMSKTVGEAEVTAITAPVCIVTVTYATAVVPEVSEGKASATVSEDIEIPEDEPLTISAVAGAEATETAVTIPAALAEKLDNASSLELTTNAGTITFDNAALSQMTGGKAVEISMAAEPQQNGDIVLELTAKADGENVFAENGSGTATVAIPVEAPGEGEELHVYYNDGETLTRIPAHYENGKLVVTLTHFSEYVIKTEEPDTGFTVTADSTVAATIGEDVAITLSIAAPNEKFNAYHFVLGYDSAKLEYKSFSIEGAEVVNKDGTLTIAGYGADKTANPVITFTTKAVGTSTVSLTTARLDEAANANTKDAPDATVINGSTKVTANAYTVSLPAGFSGEKTVQPGASYTFTANDKNYSYELSATVGGTPVEITDNKDGSFTIANVSGALVITEVSRTGKSVSVSVDQSGTGKDDVTADATATYGTDYGFTVTKADNYSYTVSMTINGAGYTAFTVSGNDYTIPGNALTGNVVIKVDKTYSGATDTRTVTVTGTGKDDVTAAATATQGTNFSFTLTKAAGYEYSVTVTIGSAVYEPAVSDNQYTIAGAALTGDVTISVTKTVIITVSVSKYLELNAKTMYLVVATSATLPEGETLAYGETTMFSSEKYQGYAYLVISEESADTVKAAAEEAIKQVTATSTAVDYSGDVNGTGLVDINDAQLTYNIYNVRYESFEALAMARFLAADVNGDKEVNVTDAAAIVSTVLGK